MEGPESPGQLVKHACLADDSTLLLAGESASTNACRDDNNVEMKIYDCEISKDQAILAAEGTFICMNAAAMFAAPTWVQVPLRSPRIPLKMKTIRVPLVFAMCAAAHLFLASRSCNPLHLMHTQATCHNPAAALVPAPTFHRYTLECSTRRVTTHMELGFDLVGHNLALRHVHYAQSRWYTQRMQRVGSASRRLSSGSATAVIPT